jgi:hypothetical protein
MIVLKENERVSQIVVNEVSTAGEGSCMVVPTSLCTFTTPETSHTVIREVSTLLRGSLSMGENRSRLSGSRTLSAELTFDNFAAEGDANRFSTSDSQRSCAARSFEVPGAESCFITAITFHYSDYDYSCCGKRRYRNRDKPHSCAPLGRPTRVAARRLPLSHRARLEGLEAIQRVAPSPAPARPTASTTTARTGLISQ